MQPQPCLVLNPDAQLFFAEFCDGAATWTPHPAQAYHFPTRTDAEDLMRVYLESTGQAKQATYSIVPAHCITLNADRLTS